MRELMALCAGLIMVLGASAASAQSVNQVCPEGYDESPFNTTISNRAGCTICSRSSGEPVVPTEPCQVECGMAPIPPICAPDVDLQACCRDLPCAINCPERPLGCSTVQCVCEPEGCCFEVCPGDRQPAPTASSYGIAALLIALGGFGAWRLSRRAE